MRLGKLRRLGLLLALLALVATACAGEEGGGGGQTAGEPKRGGEIPGAQLNNPQPVLMVRTK